jgi:flagellar biosynthetic protein FlhB
MAEGDQDKTEQPTQYRLDEARKRGEVAKSTDLAGTLGLMGFAVTMLLTAPAIIAALVYVMRQLIGVAGARPNLSAGFAAWAGGTASGLLQSLAPLVMVLLVVGVVAHLVQTGPMFSSEALRVDFKRMNPANAIKRVFSLKTLWEIFKLGVKLGLLGALAWYAAGRLAVWVAAIAGSSVADLPQRLRDGFWQTSLYVLAILIIAAVLDVLFVRKDHMKRMRMSRRELRDETRRRDGDPEIKSRRRRQSRELLKKVRALPRTADADVVLTNPTEYAIAVQYRPSSMRAPVVLAKGRGVIAAQVRRIANRADVPIIRSPELARALYREVDIDAPVPEALFSQLAPVYRRLFAQGHARAAR